jgi:hypothetical protein
MANSGAVVWYRTLSWLRQNGKHWSIFAKITLVASVGHRTMLPPEAVEKLLDVRERAGYMPSGARGCQACGFPQGHFLHVWRLVEQLTTPRTEMITVTLSRRELTALITMKQLVWLPRNNELVLTIHQQCKEQ